MDIKITRGRLKIYFNGKLYLVSFPEYCSQYLGSGETETEAIENCIKTLNNTIKDHDCGFFQHSTKYCPVYKWQKDNYNFTI